MLQNLTTQLPGILGIFALLGVAVVGLDILARISRKR